MPNKLEMILVMLVILIATVLTGIIFPLLISTDKLPISVIITLFLLILLLMVIGVQAIANHFYVRWQRNLKKNKK